MERIPLPRLGTPEEVAYVVRFLLDDRAAYITGATIPINGGMYLYEQATLEGGGAQRVFGGQAQPVAAQQDGTFDAEIIPVPLPSGTILRRDDCPRPGATREVFGALKSAFRVDGRVTSGKCVPAQ